MKFIIAEALEKAVILHEGQMRKGKSPVSYINHPVRVGLILQKYTDNEEIIAAGILHDTIEDTQYTYDQISTDFGKNTATWVNNVSHDVSIKDELLRNKLTIAKAAEAPESMMVKFADTIANMQDISRGIEREGIEFWNYLAGGKERKVQYYEQIFETGKDVVPEGMRAEFEHTFKFLNSLE